MTGNNPIRDFYSYQALQLQGLVDASKKIIDHNLTKGIEAEKILEDLLASLLPSRYKTSKGFIINSAGKISSEIDLMIFDEANNPRMFNFKSFELIPIEACSGLVEVKTTLRSRDIRKTFRSYSNIRKMKFVKEAKVSTKPSIIDNNSGTANIEAASTTYPEMYIFSYDSEVGKKQVTNIYKKYPAIGNTVVCILNQGIYAKFDKPQERKGLRFLYPKGETKTFRGMVLALFLFWFLLPTLGRQVKGELFWKQYLPGESVLEKLDD